MSVQSWGTVLIALALLSVPDVPASAQSARANLAPACGGDAAIPEPWRAWRENPVAVTAAVSPAVDANIVLGKKAAVTLASAQLVRMAVTAPGANPLPGARGGMLSFQPTASAIAISLSPFCADTT